MAKIDDPDFGPAFDAKAFEEKDWLNTGVTAPRGNVLSRGHNDRQGFWRPDALPGLSPKAMGRKKWNPLDADIGNSYLQDIDWHPHGSETSAPEAPHTSSMAGQSWFRSLFPKE